MPDAGDIDAEVFERRAGRLRIRGAELTLDPPSPALLAVITHAHADHVAEHARAIVTAPTASVLRARGYAGALEIVAPGEVFEIDGVPVDLVPAGHVPGAVMVRARRGGQVGVYTGDLGRAADAWLGAPAALTCDELVVDAMGGAPHRRFPSLDEAAGALVRVVAEAIARGATPVVFADAFGRGQRVALALVAQGFEVRATPTVRRVHQALAPWWPDLGRVGLLARTVPDGVVVQMARPAMFGGARTFHRQVRVACVGATWALQHALPVDEIVPMVDHGDHDETLAWVRATGARRVFATGPHADALVAALGPFGIAATPWAAASMPPGAP